MLLSSAIFLFVILQTCPASADRRFGCLFERNLCTLYEICVNDGMFGRCHSLPLEEVYSYDVTLPVVQHFRLLLDQMANRGLTWEDDTTQQVLAKELYKIRRVPHRLSLSGATYKTDSRTEAAVMNPVEHRLKPAEAELNRNLQTYLQHLGLLPKTSGTEGLIIASKDGPVQSDPTIQKTSPSLKGKQNLSAEELQVLLNVLRQLLSRHPDPSPRLRPIYSYGTESSVPKTLKSRPNNLDKSKGSSAKEPLTLVDEKFIQNVLRNIGKQHLDVDNLSPHDVDQLSNLIVDALQVVDNGRGKDRVRVQPGPRDLEGELSDGQERKEEAVRDDHEKFMEEAPTVKITLANAPQEVHSLTENNNMEEKDESPNVFSKLLAYLDQSPFTASPPPRPQRRAGLENVHSRTREVGVMVEKKDTTQSMEEVSEVEGWIKEVAPPHAALKYEASHKKMLSVPELQLDVNADRKKADDIFGYVITDTDGLQTDEGLHMMEILAHMARIQMTDFAELSVVGPAVTFKVSPNRQNVSTADVVHVAVDQKASLEKEAKLSILEAGVADGNHINQIPTKYSQAESTKFLVLTVVSILCIVGVLLASTVVYCLRHRSHHKLKEKLTNLGADTSGDATATYQDLCRQRMAVKPQAERRPEPASSRINSVSSQFSDGGTAVSPSARSSLSSWSEEPAHPNMDISTGHMILSYMEDHLKNKDRLEKEWEALCAYQAEPNTSTMGLKDGNAKKNRSAAVVAYDHSRITLRLENSQGNSDYINASPIMDHDPRNPAYIATQGPLPSTVADFWQMVWENGCVVIVMLTPLVESGVKQCYHYWPDEGSNLYHIYEVNLVSEHIWCDDFLVRSFYLKNMQTNETRTVTQFHFLTWLNQNVPETSRTLLDFRRKVNKCYRGRSCPVIVHCSDGAGRTGTYILIDMVLNKMAKGAKEIDIAATLEHLRDQRPGMVQTKDQFEFVLTTVAEEVNAILKALPQ
ncbi:receptor-type tyrosine-protein phosphatase N2-like [Nerophis ophidion]|uniref:receptor-type tyrosine-protein phosphatase N2-like n=1 Tax=Nerophis ophidion TaxID=159077 RepID=UPI002ADF6F06|nr:receptor-type tyrosine-protein phosphatase N2-like [Nerophis ophidion]